METQNYETSALPTVLGRQAKLKTGDRENNFPAFFLLFTVLVWVLLI